MPVAGLKSAPDGWVLDLDGVVWVGSNALPGAAGAIQQLRGSGAPVVFVTNASDKTITEVESKLESFGIEATGSVITSAIAAARLIDPGERVFVVGGPGIVEAVEQSGGIVCDSEPTERRHSRDWALTSITTP